MDVDEQTGIDPGVDAGIDQLENYANDPANASNQGGEDRNYVDRLKARTGNDGVSNVKGGAGNRFSRAMGTLRAGASRNKKTIGIAGGSLALIVMVVAGIIGVIANELDSLVNNIYHKEFAKVERSIQKRAGKIIAKEIYAKAFNKAVVSDNPLLKKLYDNVPMDKIESELNNRGYKFGTEGGELKVTTPEGDFKFASVDDFGNFVDSTSGAGSAMSDAIGSVSEEQTKYLEVMQRRFLRLLMQNEFDIKSWKVYNDETGDKATTEVADAEQGAAIDPLKDTVGADVSCVLGSDSECPAKDDKRRFPDGNRVDHPTWESTNGQQDGNPPNEGSCANADGKGPAAKGCDLNSDPNGDQNAKDFNKALAGQADGAANGELESKASQELTKEITDKIGSTTNEIAILNTAAEIDHALYNNTIGYAINARREMQYAGVFINLEKMASDIHSGAAVSGDEVNATMKLLQANKVTKVGGIEDSKAFSAIFNGDPSKGIGIDPSKLLNGDSTSSAGKISIWYKDHFGPVHDVLDAFRSTVGQVFNLLGSLLGNIVSKIPGMSSVNKFLAEKVSQLVNYALGTVVTGTETGVNIANAADAGGSVVAESEMRDTLGAPMVSATANANINREIAAENDAANAKLPITERLFATANPDSLVNRLAIIGPHSFGQAASDTGSYIASVMTNPAHFFASIFSGNLVSHALAAGGANTLVDYGNQHYAYSDAQLNEPLALPTGDIGGVENPDGSINTTPDGQIDQNDCPQVTDAKQGNECLLDTATLITLGSMSTSANDGGINSQ